MGVRSFLADTNIISETYKPKQDPIIAHWFKQQPDLVLSFPVIFEIEWGIFNKSHDVEGALKLRLWLDRLLETSGRLLLDMTPEVAHRQAKMMQVAQLNELWMTTSKKRNRPPGQDLAIAALAIEYQLPVATNNCRDFLRINQHFPLPGVFTPATQTWIIPLVPKSRLRRGDANADANAKIPHPVC